MLWSNSTDKHVKLWQFRDFWDHTIRQWQDLEYLYNLMGLLHIEWRKDRVEVALSLYNRSAQTPVHEHLHIQFFCHMFPEEVCGQLSLYDSSRRPRNVRECYLGAQQGI
jgi:hypothetical protein